VELESDRPRYSEGEVAFLQAEILRACRLKRIPATHREDFVNEIWLWLMKLNTHPDFKPAWVMAVVGSFWLRYQRKMMRRHAREVPLESLRETVLPSVAGVTPAADEGLDLREYTKFLPGSCCRLVQLLSEGVRWNDACATLGIPPGSRSYWRARLRATARALGERI
jgi:hypothetical protein